MPTKPDGLRVVQSSHAATRENNYLRFSNRQQ